jgi:glycosyltransferase involved in cell wall biosynthesis
VTELSILMPAYNEQETIQHAIERVLATEALQGNLELVVIDNGSRDGTRDILENGQWPENVRSLRIENNRGKGDAIRYGLQHATGTYTGVLDADLEYDPGDLATMLEPLREGIADAVFGTRMFQAHTAYGFWYVVGNKVLNLAASLVYDAWLTDFNACLKVMPTELFRALPLRSNGFTIEAEITARVLRSGARLHEMPISYVARQREEGKKVKAADGLQELWTLLRCRVR